MVFKDDDDREFGVSRKIMLAAIFTLFAAVLLIVFIYLYSRYLVTRRQQRMRRAAFNQLSRQIAPDVEAAAAAANYPREPPKTGLDPLVIASFPTYPYKAVDKSQIDNGESKETECSVCLSTIVEEAMVRVLPNCKHMFHAECIDVWLGSNTTCPVCRRVAEPRVQPEKKEVQPSAPPLETEKGPSGSSGSRLGSFRLMVTSRERPSRTRSYGDEIGALDLERH